MESLKLLIDSIAHTLAAIANFTILLGLFIYVYSLLGMQFFSGKIKFNELDQYDLENGRSPRGNFDTLLNAIISIFIILVGDNWNIFMYDGIRSVGWLSTLYYISLVVFGNIVMLNLFLAILLGNFDEASIMMKEKKYIEENIKQKKSMMATVAAIDVIENH